MRIGIGVDVGGTKILACAVDEHGERVAETRTDSPKTPALVLEAIVGATTGLIGLLGDRRRDVVGVGVGVPSLVGRDGRVHESANLPALEELPLRDAFEIEVSKVLEPGNDEAVRFVIDNDATCAVVGEHVFGAARAHHDVALVTLGTGIGGGIVAGGRVLRGGRGFAGEFGHMVIDPDGPLCPCGRRGCFERYASGSGLGWIARTAVAAGRGDAVLIAAGGSLEAVRGEHVLIAARAGDAEAIEVFAQVGRYVAIGVGNIVEILDCDLVLLGGGLAAAGDYLMGPTRDEFAHQRRGSGARAVPIEWAALGEYAGAYGAAALGLSLIE